MIQQVKLKNKISNTTSNLKSTLGISENKSKKRRY